MTVDALPIRAIEPAEFDAFSAATERAFSGHGEEDEREIDRRIFEYDRTLAAYDGDAIVATAGAFSLEMTVPGGPAPVAGVTVVGVLPTHRRRGLLTALMTRQLGDLHEQGREPVAALWASEPAIYGRFGYGLASQHLSVTVRRGWNRFLPSAPAETGRLVLDEPAKVRADLDRVFDAVRRTRPGHFARSSGFWDMRLFDPERRRNGAGPLRCVVHEGPDGVDGYALYAAKQHWDDGGPEGTISVREVTAADPAAHAALWRFLCDIDLMASVAGWTATDDPLLHLLADPRRATPVVKDNLWVRIVDLGRALTARGYTAPVDVVLDVADTGCPWNAGRWRLAADATGATCDRTSEPADLAITGTELGAAYLGGTTLATLAAAGRVTELRPGTLEPASLAFGGAGRAPYCPQIF
jgi:predicted acetyltransferase